MRTVRSVRAALLVVAAHPDDETIGAAGLLFRAGTAAVVHLTVGAPRDPRLRPAMPDDREAYARLRRRETLAALAEVRVPEERALALGAIDQEAVHALAPLARELAAAIRALRPRLLVTHAVEGGHPDHDATALAVRAARALLARAGREVPRALEMTSYHRRDGALETGAFLAGPPEVARRLRPEERAAKRRMLARYASQRDVLAPFGVDEERFRPAAPVDLARRPHPGPLWYEALGWTTFQEFRARARDAAASLGLEEDLWR